MTALKVQKRNPNRVNVYLDDRFAFGLARIVAAWLSIGEVLDEARIEKLRQQDTAEVAVQSALRLLSYRPRSEAEVRGRLEKKGFTEEVIAETLTRLREGGLLDDQQFARSWVDNQSNFRPRGRRALNMELRLKGIAEEAIQQALDSAADEETLAYQAGVRHARRFRELEWNEFRLKLGQFLARRGFSYGTIVPTVRRIWDELRLEQPLARPGHDNDNDEEEEAWIT